MKEEHELVEEFKSNVYAWEKIIIGCERAEQILNQISLELMIADRFYEINPDLWEQFKKELLADEI